MLAKPDYELSSIFGSDHIYNPNASFVDSTWVQGDRTIRDFRTGDHMPIAGDLPIICHKAVATPRGMAILHDAGVPCARHLEVYECRDSYNDLLQSLTRRYPKIVMQHAHPVDEVMPNNYWITRSLLCALNNKANIQQFVPKKNLSRRRVFDAHSINPSDIELPVVLKIATDRTTGGGSGVRICHTCTDIIEAVVEFGSDGRIVVEEFLEIERSFCVQFVASSTGKIRSLGMAEQVSNDNGRFLGSWFDASIRHPEAMQRIGRTVMGNGVRKGFHGIAGFDIAQCQDGRLLVLDLNFRLNGSTAPLILHSQLMQKLAMPVMRYAAWRGPRDFNVFEKFLRKIIGDNIFVPLNIYHPSEVASPGEYPLVAGILAGKTREEIAQRYRLMASGGFDQL